MRELSTKYRKLGLALGIVLALSLVTSWLLAQSRPEDLRSVIASQYGDVAWINVPILRQWLTEEPPPRLLDARRTDEFAVSHLRGALRIDPDEPELSALDASHEQRIVVYCSVGYRSAQIARALARAGFTHVFNLEGGIFAWANAGHPVYARGERVSVVHPYDAVWGRFLRPELRSAPAAE